MNKHVITTVFLILQVVLYIWFLVLDITDGNILLSNRLKYITVILCLLYVLLLWRKEKENKAIYLLWFALLFTAVSDLILLFMTDIYYVLGVITFIVAQQLHGLRLIYLKQESVQEIKHGLIPQWSKIVMIQLLITLMICMLLQWMKVSIDPLIIVTAFYFVSLCTNVLHSVSLVSIKKTGQILLYASGLILFLLCDISVGIFNLSSFISLTTPIYDLLYSVSAVLMWFFYAPSQTLISLSAASNIAIIPKK